MCNYICLDVDFSEDIHDQTISADSYILLDTENKRVVTYVKDKDWNFMIGSKDVSIQNVRRVTSRRGDTKEVFVPEHISVSEITQAKLNRLALAGYRIAEVDVFG